MPSCEPPPKRPAVTGAFAYLHGAATGTAAALGFWLASRLFSEPAGYAVAAVILVTGSVDFGFRLGRAARRE